MSKIRYCEECNEPIRWDEEIVQTEDGDLYREDCCCIFPIRYGVMVGDNYKGNTENESEIACSILDYGEYIDSEEREGE